MLREQIVELRKNIEASYLAKINKLKEEMDAALVSLSKVEETLFNSTETVHTGVRINRGSTDIISQTGPVIHRRRRATKLSKITVGERMDRALENTEGDFTRLGLFDSINSDKTTVKIPNGSLAVEFAKRVKDGRIIVIRQLRGNIPAIYRRAGVSAQEQSSTSLFAPGNFVVEGKGELS